MKKLIQYLGEKTQYLEKFYGLNETHVPQFRVGNYSQIDYFYDSREKILDIIAYLDEVIREEMKNLGHLNLDTIQEEVVKDQVQYQTGMREYILKQDLEVISLLDQAKTKIIGELKSVQSARKLNIATHSGSRTNLYDKEA